MDVESIRTHCLSKNLAQESMPFGNETLVFKVNNRIFLLLSLDQHPPRINVKCDPEKAEALRERYASVVPGYHMNKKHWNTVICDSSIPKSLILQWINESYDLVNAIGSKKNR